MRKSCFPRLPCRLRQSASASEVMSSRSGIPYASKPIPRQFLRYHRLRMFFRIPELFRRIRWSQHSPVAGGFPTMSDVYAINVAKTEFREGYNDGDVDRLMAVFQPGGFTDMSEGEPSKYGSEATAVWRKRLADLFEEYRVKLTPIIIDIVV